MSTSTEQSKGQLFFELAVVVLPVVALASVYTVSMYLFFFGHTDHPVSTFRRNTGFFLLQLIPVGVFGPFAYDTLKARLARKK